MPEPVDDAVGIPVLTAESPAVVVMTESPAATAPSQSARLPGPVESLAWTAGVFLAHLLAGAGVIVVLIAAYASFGGSIQEYSQFDRLIQDNMWAVLGGDQLSVLLVTVIAISLRFSRRSSQVLNLQPLHPLHCAAIAALLLPLSTVSHEVYGVASAAWEWAATSWPMLRLLDGGNAVEQLAGMSDGFSFPAMVLVIAICPALSEELVFRGVIGRGLVARWGLVPGIIVASMLFAMVHFHPVHALAVLPLGIALHFVYLATRSFWAPVLLHFLNNAWACSVSRIASGDAATTSLPDAAISPALVLASVAVVAALMALMWTTRPEYVLPDGTLWSPGYVTAEAPPPELQARRTFGRCSGRSLLTAASAWGAFGASLITQLAFAAR